MVICLEQGADFLHMLQLMSLHSKRHNLLTHLKFRLVLPSGTGLPSLSWKIAC